MTRLARAAEIAAWSLFFAVAVAVLALRFWLLPDIERYREDIVAALSRGIGLPVRVGRIEAGWLGLRPQITLTDVRIHDAQGREALVLPSLDNVLAWQSLLRGELRLHRLVIDGPRLAVRRDAAGEFYVAGLRLTRGEAGAGGALLAHGDILVRNAEIEWRDELRGAPPLTLSGVDLHWVSAGSAHSLGVSARPPAELGTRVELRALLDSTEVQLHALSGRLFLQLGYTDLAAWRAWVDYPLDVRQGQGALRVWATLDKGALREATADVALADVWATLGDHLEPLELAAVRGRVHARSLADGIELSGRGLALELDRGPQVPQTDFEIVWRPQAGGVLAASLIDLQAATQLVESLPLPPQIAQTLAELAPRGRLADSRVEWSGPFDAPQRLSARARFSDLTLSARGEAPGFTRLSGTLEATQEKGKLSLAARKAELEWPRFLAQPVALDTLAGELEWSRDAAGALALRIASLSFANDDVSGNFFGTYAQAAEGPGSVDLSGILNRANGAALARYLPRAEVMGEGIHRWLTSAIVAGEASDVRVRVRGDLRQFPFADPASGQFQVTARVDKGVLDYAPGWPRIEDIAAELNFEGQRLQVAGRSGAILGARLSAVQVSVPNLARNAHVLVSGQAEGPTAEFLKYLESSPLRKATGGHTADIKATGRGKLRLKLDLPLANVDKTRVSGDYEFAGNDVSVLPGLPPLEQAGGRVAFTDAGFTLQETRARFLGGAVALAGGVQSGRGLEIVARGDATVDAARTLAEHPLARHVSGTFGYVLTVQARDGPARVSFESPLRGLESALPAPLGKSAGDTLPLRVEIVPVSAERDRIVVALGTLARAEIARRRQGIEMQVQRTAVWLTPEPGQPIRLPERPGTLVYGSLAAFDLDRWLPLLPGSEQASQGAQISFDIRLGSLIAFGRPFGNVALRASAEPAGWSANVVADEVAGDVSFRAAEGGRLVARLAHLAIPADAPGAKPAPGGARPSELPAIDLVADNFTFRGKPLGRVELLARRAGEDWRIEKAAMTNPDATLAASGVWRAAPSRTTVDFDLHAGDAGEFLARVGHPGLVKGGKARLHGTLDWQGDPGTLDFPSLAGELQLNAEDGQFLEIEPGLGKLVSLMSLQALPRRIALDFRDVFSKGFQFDRIGAAANVERGTLRLKEFRMRGSAADVEMSGEADIARETQNLRVRVVPSLGDSAAIGIGLFNPVAGIAAAIAQRVLKNPLGHIFAFDYSVTGTWSDPKVAKIQSAAPAESREP